MDPRKKRPVEPDEFEQLDVELPAYPAPAGKTASYPFSRSKHRFYTIEGLASPGGGNTSRTRFFIETARKIYAQIGRPVPYAFRDRKGNAWSMDAGCLAYVGPSGQRLADYVIHDDYIVALTPKANSQDAADDIADIVKSTDIPATEREALIAARIGQGRFRKDVLEQWDNKCAVTGCRVLEAIRASHILPWRTATNSQRLEPENGLPLIATLDALFDKGLISFTDSGQLLAKELLAPEEQKLLLSGKGLLSVPSQKTARYLSRHRKAFGFED